MDIRDKADIAVQAKAASAVIAVLVDSAVTAVKVASVDIAAKVDSAG